MWYCFVSSSSFFYIFFKCLIVIVVIATQGCSQSLIPEWARTLTQSSPFPVVSHPSRKALATPLLQPYALTKWLWVQFGDGGHIIISVLYTHR